MMGQEERASAMRCIQPAYVARFLCDGAKCDAKCCRGWHVQLDEAAYERFSSLEPIHLREEVLAAIRRDEATGKPELVHREGDTCAFLREDRLCALQKALGEDMLSDVCAEYPRKTRRFPHLLERALSLDCPQAAELALLWPGAMPFDEILLEHPREAYFLVADDEELIREISFFDLQFRGIQILQRQDLDLRSRLLLLGAFLDHGDELLTRGRGQELARLAASYAEGEGGQGALRVLRELPASPGMGLAYAQGLLSYLAEQEEDDETTTLRCMERAARAFGAGTGSAVSPIGDGQLAVLRDRLLAEHGQMLEHYLVNTYFMELCPCMADGSFGHNWQVFVSLWKLLELYLLSLAATRGAVSQADVLEAAGWLSRRAGHFVGFLEDVGEYVGKEAGTAIEFMEIV